MYINSCRNPGYENFLDMEIILNMEDKHHTLIHRLAIGRKYKIYCQVYNLYANTLH